MQRRLVSGILALSVWLALPALGSGEAHRTGKVPGVEVLAAENPLQAPATALALTSRRLVMGLADGGVALMDLRTRRGIAVRLPEPAAPVRAVAFASGRVLWRTGETIYAFDLADQSVSTADEWPDESAPVAQRDARTITLPDGRMVSTLYKENFPGGSGPVALAGEQVWWATRDTIFHCDLTTGRTSAYLPWNGAKGEVKALVADKSGAWIATATSGIRRIRRDGATFDGYLRARLGEGTQTPTDDARSTIAEEMAGWFGVPYRYGGQDKTGCDCSGFVGAMLRCVGVELPRTSAAIAKAGEPVEGDLQWGDIVCFPGHVALYVGNGRTVEAFNEKKPLGPGSVWHRNVTVVRRFLR